MVEDSGKYVLKVLCGGAGMFEVNYQLTDSEANTAKEDEEYCSFLANKIRQSPSKYS